MAKFFVFLRSVQHLLEHHGISRFDVIVQSLLKADRVFEDQYSNALAVQMLDEVHLNDLIPSPVMRFSGKEYAVVAGNRVQEF